VISVSRLTKAYGQTLAVDGISFDVSKGQIVGFLGPNGAGKSTTLRMLTCYLPPTSGGATVAGFDIFHQSLQVREHLGYLPENVPLYTEMKVQEYLDFRGRLRKMDRTTRQKRIDYVVERCWLGNVRKRAIGHLSKGYRQRVGLADALLHNPPVLILDEPTVGLDPTQIRETRKLIKDLGGDHTLLLSTHILPEVEAVCDRAIVIAGGRIVAQGSPDDLRASRRMQARVLVECKGPARDVEMALARVSGVQKVEIVNGDVRGERGYVTAAVRPEESRDVREEVARTVIQHGWPLREIKLEHATLEEFFVQVTANQAMATSAPAEVA
jgi:ABC-2 type transport system ATP-binding protein